jgi:hypothetical protein
MKLQFWSHLLLKITPVFFVLGLLCLAAFYLLKRPATSGETAPRQKKWLYLSAGSYFLSVLFLILGLTATFFLYFPDQGDFKNVERIGGKTVAVNDEGSFVISDLTEMYDPGKKYPYHTVMLNIWSHFEDPVTIKSFKVISRMDQQELAVYRCASRLPIKMKYKSSTFLIFRGKVTKRIEEHAKKGNKDDYGSTAYLSLASSQGRLPGIPLYFEEPKAK